MINKTYTIKKSVHPYIAPNKPYHTEDIEVTVNITEKEFMQKVMDSNNPVVVEFNSSLSLVSAIATKRMISVLGKYNGQIKVLRCDDCNPSLLGIYNISNIPTYLFFYKGKIQDKLSGIANENEIEEKIKKLISCSSQ